MTDSVLFDEPAHAGREHLDLAYVAAYDAKAQFDPAEDLSVLAAHGLGAASTLVDLGCGTGTLALAAAQSCRRVVALDVSPAMLDAARARVRAAGLANVEVVEAGLLSYEHAGEPPDAVYSRNTLHHLPDLWKAVAIKRISTMLRPGAVFLLSDLVLSCEADEFDVVVQAWLEDAPANPPEGWTRAERAQHLAEEYSTFSWLLEPMLERAGFEIVDSRFRAKIYAQYVCTKR